MDSLIGGVVMIAIVGLGIIITKALWQWVLGTDILIKEAQKQTELMERIVEILGKD